MQQHRELRHVIALHVQGESHGCISKSCLVDGKKAQERGTAPSRSYDSRWNADGILVEQATKGE